MLYPQEEALVSIYVYSEDQIHGVIATRGQMIIIDPVQGALPHVCDNSLMLCTQKAAYINDILNPP